MDVDSDPAARRMTSILDSRNLFQHVLYPTHTSGHTLDLILSRSDELHFWNFVYDESVRSDHVCITCSVNLNKPRRLKKEITCRKWKEINVDDFRKDIESSMASVGTANSMTDAVNKYNCVLKETLDTHAPPKTKTVSLRPKTPWFNENIRQAKQLRRKLEHKMRQSKLVIDRQIHSSQRNLVNRLVDEAKQSHYNNIIKEASSQKEVFSACNNLLFRKKNNTLPTLSSAENLAETFSSFFNDKILKIRTGLAETQASTMNVDSSCSGSNCQSADNTSRLSSFQPATCDEIRKLFLKSPTKSCSLDPLPSWLLKLSVEETLPMITQIVNLSLASCELAPCLKEALIRPLLKKPNLDPDVLKNYRPVSNLTFLSKLIERVVASRLQVHLKDGNLHETMQSAYKLGHSTQSALLRVQNDLLMSIDSEGGAALVLLDLRSRPSRALDVPITRKKHFGDRAFCKVGPLIWNSLPQHIQDSDNITNFKHQLKTHLFNLAFA